MEINPAYHPNYDDGSDRYIVVQCDTQDTAALADRGAHARQMARSILRKRTARAYHSEKDDLIGILDAENIKGPRLSREEQRHCSEWLTTALRHKPFHNNHLSD
eukprot:5305406-Pyramimonas_sp.AAC.1